MKRIILFVASLLAALAAQASDQPNIIFMMADDLGYGDLSSYNPNTEGEAPNNTPIRTPNLDQMAARGARFTDFHSAAPICSPARRALLTGRYPSRLGEWAEAYRSRPEGVIAAEEPTIGMWLKQAGYATACYGKWNV
ncbi:MAG: sulfatase-like hydrolase/transferase, partial [Coraliomargarita sp.]